MKKIRSLKAEEIDCRVSTVKRNGCSLLLYKDARCDMNILDETFGAENWQRKHELINGNLFCSVGIRFIHEDSGQAEWIWKQDVGVESYTEKEKGQASDAFKRACFNWGIGRELYTAPFIWVPDGKCAIEPRSGGAFTTRDKFIVSEMEVSGGRITGLKIMNDRTKEVVYVLRPAAGQKEKAPSGRSQEAKPREPRLADAETKKKIWSLCKKAGKSFSRWAETFGETYETLTRETAEKMLEGLSALERSNENNR